MLNIKTIQNASLLRRIACCTIFPVVLLVGCDRISSDLAHSGRPNPSQTGWFKSQYKAFWLCNKTARKTSEFGENKRICPVSSGLITDLMSTSPNLNAKVSWACKINKEPAYETCDIVNGNSTRNNVYIGYYRYAYKLCKNALFNARLHENREPSIVVVLDYGFRAKDLKKSSKYSLELAVKWGVFDPLRSKTTRPGSYFSILSYERSRVTCEVNDNQVVKISYRDLGEVSWNERGLLDHRKFFN